MDTISIEAENLRKTFQNVSFWECRGGKDSLRLRNRAEGRLLSAGKDSAIAAVRDISFTIQRGDIVGFIGANGAGKSTTIKLLTGILTPDSGSIRIHGLDYKKSRREILMKIGVVFGQRSVLCWDIPVIDSFRLFKDMYRIPGEVYRQNLAVFSDILKLQDFMYKPPRLLSLGQRMKADLAAALLYNPEILFLDEPTIGIDVLAKERIREFICRINEERHTTVILTTHDVSDIEALCRKMLVMDRGRILYDGSLEALKRKFVMEYGERQNVAEAELEGIIKHIYEGSFL